MGQQLVGQQLARLMRRFLSCTDESPKQVVTRERFLQTGWPSVRASGSRRVPRRDLRGHLWARKLCLIVMHLGLIPYSVPLFLGLI